MSNPGVTVISADNGVYILITRDSHKIVKTDFSDTFGDVESWLNTFGEGIIAYRVAHAQAIDNFDWYEKNQLYMLGSYMKDVWGHSPVFYDLESAEKYAKQLHDEVGWSKYGICKIRAERYSFT